jgi:predicted dehydrogenase
MIGSGAIARDQHLPGWQLFPEAQVVALADSSAAALDAVGNQFQIARRELDYRRLLDDPSIDAVDICAPSALHAEISIAALEAGKHVLCEKPMATSRADAAAMLAAHKRSGKKLMIGQHLRFDPAIVQLRAWLTGAPLGDIYYVRSQWLRRRRLPARPGFTARELSGGGAIYDIGVHMLDLAMWMMGNPRPLAVSGVVFDHLARRGGLTSEWGEWDHRTIDVDDFAAGLIRFENGAALSLEASWLGFQAERELWRLQLYGTHGGAVWPEGSVFGERDGIPWDLKLGEPKGQKPHHAVVHSFARAVINDTPVPIPAVQSANNVAVLDALHRSSVTRRETVVEVIE